MSNPQYLHGKRTEALFEMVVASLGSVQLIKQEDTGDVFYVADGDIEVPDFRVVLSDGQQCLIEVKNYYQKNGFAEYRLKKPYVDDLVAYARIMGCRLLFAVYWTRWNTWTLTDARRLERTGEKYTLNLADAHVYNLMTLLGDKMIGTRKPIRLRFAVDLVRRSKEGASERQTLRIRSSQVFSEERVLTAMDERRFAMFLAFHGEWEETRREEFDESGAVTAVNFEYLPRDERDTEEKQGFSQIGTLSGMLSREYALKTIRDGRVANVKGRFQPGRAGTLVPEHRADSRLPLWVLVQEASECA
ncbi:MAG: hypothetical protein ACM34E_14795 [Acidobacteriota bacterium]